MHLCPTFGYTTRPYNTAKECPEITIVPREQVILLGAAWGDSSLEELMTEKHTGVRRLCERIKDVPSHQ